MLPDELRNGILIIKLFPEHHNVTLGSQMTAEDVVSGNKYGRTTYGWFIPSLQCEKKREEDDPYD